MLAMHEIEDVIVKIHATPHQSALVVAGAGSSALSWLLGVSGASRTLLEALVPYGRFSMIDLVGQEPAQYVSPQNARAMARAAYRRGLTLREDDFPVVGLACTATIATDRPKRGDHRACIAAWDDTRVATYNLTLDKGFRDRAGEEEVVSRLVIYALARAFGVAADLDLQRDLGLTGREQPEILSEAHPGPVQRLLSGEVNLVLAQPDGRLTPSDAPVAPGRPAPGLSPAGSQTGNRSKLAVLPGSFSPLHYGHEELARSAGEMLDCAVVYELSVLNVDKPPLTESEIMRRVGGFAGRGSVALTRAPTFRKKADLFPGCVFVIGWDTLIRLIDPKYYGGEEVAMLTALAEIWALGCRFLVAGRESGGVFHTLAEVAIPPGFRPLFKAIPEGRFRADVSSTQLRELEERDG